MRNAVSHFGKPATKVAINSIVVMAHPQASFPMDAPEEVLYLGDIRYYLRRAYLRAERNGSLLSTADADRLREKILELRDAEPDAKHRFLLELASKNPNAAQNYLSLENAYQSLRKRPLPRQRPFWKSAINYLPIVIALTGEAAYLGMQKLESMAKDEKKAAVAAQEIGSAPPKARRFHPAR
jgi:hypothetical protein